MSHHLKHTQLNYKDNKLLNYCFGWGTKPGYKVKYSVLVMEVCHILMKKVVMKAFIFLKIHEPTYL